MNQIRPPDYRMSVLNKETNARAEMGVAWRQDDGSISIKLNPFVVVDPKDDNLTIRLFPTGGNQAKAPPAKVRRTQPDFDQNNEIPF